MSSEPAQKSFLDTGLDWNSDAFGPEEKQRLLAWYADNHGTNSGGVSISRFPEFLIEHNPSGFKRYRRHIAQIDAPRDGVALPDAAHLLMFTYTYAHFGFETGLIYAVINARRLGASREEVTDVLRLATLAAGPFGSETAAVRTDEYLRAWPLDEPGPGVVWPEGWSAQPDALHSGIDLTTDELTRDELELLRAWYLKVYGEVPAHVEALAAYHPSALKTQRSRLETALGNALPAQMAPLCMLQLAAARLWERPTRRAVQLAKALGVRRHHVLSTIFWSGLYGDEMVMETALATIGDLLVDWE